MKKTISIILLIFLLINCIGCSSDVADSDSLKIICTIFPQYDWCRNLISGVGNVDIQLITKEGTDFHNFQPSASDIINIKNSDMIIYVGGESDLWIQDILSNGYTGCDVNLMSELGISDHHEDLHDDNEHFVDEHIWLSIRNALSACSLITDKLCDIDPSNANIYKSNLNLYVESLTSLDNEYKKTVNQSSNMSVVVADRNPFAYFMSDYGIECFAAYDGCHADSEVTFDTIILLAQKINELKLKNIIVTETADGKIADAVIQLLNDGDVNVLVFNSIQSVNDTYILENSYIDTMKYNLEILKQALVTSN